MGIDDIGVIKLISEAALSTILVFLIYTIVRSNGKRDEHQEKIEDRFVTMISNLLTQNRAIYTGFTARLDRNEETMAALRACYEEGHAELLGKTAEATSEIKMHVSEERTVLQQTISTELKPVVEELKILRNSLENALSGNSKQNTSIINTLDAINERIGAVLSLLQTDIKGDSNG